ncbi:MAG TPA: hypothetical protein VGB53_12845 [Rubricoccaceae bacterium]|jgi:hypothetical protein
MDWTPAHARRVLAEIFLAPEPTDVEAHDAWMAEANAAELVARIVSDGAGELDSPDDAALVRRSGGQSPYLPA